MILDHLVEIYDLLNELGFENCTGAELARSQMLMKKRAFMSRARVQVDELRRLDDE